MSASSAPGALPGRYLALALGTLAFALCFAVWGLISPLAPLFRELLGLSATEVGLLVAVPVLLGSLARIPTGMLADRYGGRLVFVALLLFLVLPLALISTAGSYWALLFWGFWLGMAGASFAVGIPFVSRWFAASEQGLALGVYGMGNIGATITNSTAPGLAAAYGWPLVFQAAIVPVILVAAVFWLLGREAPGARAATRSLGENLSLLRHRPLIWVLGLFYFVTFGGFVAMSAYLPTFLVTAYGLERGDAALRAAGFVITATLARPLGGYLSDRLSPASLLNGVFALVAMLAVLLAFQPGIVGITAAFLGSAFGFGVGNGAVFKLVALYFPRETGVIAGLVGAAGGLGGFFPPIVLGLVRDATGDYAIGFMLLSEFSLLCLIVNLLVVERRAEQLTGGGT